ncbi:hypothetical protein XELAEV_18013660mg [Xenopus laevis]|uniref:Uncharacterized protein n=1 Tax=Xenopus laevis TaxID=8355 RepID=A0A974DQ18_XENLA|nr:hypothetical protein XELAEV_18013660mg [Xenopus laevis]
MVQLVAFQLGLNWNKRSNFLEALQEHHYQLEGCQLSRTHWGKSLIALRIPSLSAGDPFAAFGLCTLRTRHQSQSKCFCGVRCEWSRVPGANTTTKPRARRFLLAVCFARSGALWLKSSDLSGATCPLLIDCDSH